MKPGEPSPSGADRDAADAVSIAVLRPGARSVRPATLLIMVALLLVAVGDLASLFRGQQAQVLSGVTAAATALPNGMVKLTAGGTVVFIDRHTGRITLSWAGPAHGQGVTIAGAAGVALAGATGSGVAGELLSTDYAHHSAEAKTLGDGANASLSIVIEHSDPRYPPMRQDLTIDGHSGMVTFDLRMGDGSGASWTAKRLDPLVAGSVGGPAGNGSGTLVFAANGLTSDHQPRLFSSLATLAGTVILPYFTVISDADGQTIAAGAVTESSSFASVQLVHQGPKLQQITLSGAGSQSGSQLHSDTFIVGVFTNLRSAMDSYARAVAVDSGAMVQAAPQLGWSSWGAYEGAVSEARVHSNADYLAAYLLKYGYDTVHIDDGWQQRYGDWVAGTKFPSGMAALASYLHARRLKASIWFAPFLAAPDSYPARIHPEWLLHNADGSPLSITLTTPEYVLDSSNPAALAYILTVCERIRAWGFDTVKLDFLFLGSLDVQRFQFNENGMQAYTAAMRLIRTTLQSGPRKPMVLIGVQQGILPAGFFTGWRVGRDIESRLNADFIPTWSEIRTEALSVSAYSFLQGIIYQSDPDDLLLRAAPGAHNLSHDELQSYLTMDALGGGIWLLGDDLPTLARQGRIAFLTNTEVLAVVKAAVSGAPLQTLDQSLGPASVWYAPLGDGSTAVGVFNWGQTARTVSVDLGAVVPRAGTHYLVRDLWNHSQRVLSNASLTVGLRPHQSVLLRVRPLS